MILLFATVTLTLTLLWEKVKPLIVKVLEATTTWDESICAIVLLEYCTWYLSWSKATKAQSSIPTDAIGTTRTPLASVDSPVTCSDKRISDPVKSRSEICRRYLPTISESKSTSIKNVRV